MKPDFGSPKPPLFRLAQAVPVLLLVGWAVFLPGCTSLQVSTQPSTPSATPTPQPSLTSTPTIEWFPPTRTPTPVVSKIPPTSTQQNLPVEADPLFIENFNNVDLWQIRRSDSGSVALGNEELTIAIYQSKFYFHSFYQGSMPPDYYLEVKVNPSLCRGEDTFGVLLRAQDEANYYLFTITCSARLRFEWLKDNRRAVLLDWVSTGQILPGAPQEIKIGVLLRGGTASIYLQDVHQFDLANLQLLSGGFGVFARSAGDNAVTVNFSEMAVYGLKEITPTPTTNPTGTPLP